jgi:hypothetical protein
MGGAGFEAFRLLTLFKHNCRPYRRRASPCQTPPSLTDLSVPANCREYHKAAAATAYGPRLARRKLGGLLAGMPATPKQGADLSQAAGINAKLAGATRWRGKGAVGELNPRALHSKARV